MSAQDGNKDLPPPYNPYPPQGPGPVAGPNQLPPGYAAPSYGFQAPPPPPQAAPGYYDPKQQPPPQHQQPGYGTAVITVQQPTYIANGCPNCRVGILMEEYSCFGIFCAIFFFPIGVLCCLMMRERRCSNCHAIF